MNNRLERIISLIDDGVGIIDVGTDHGYLPTELALRGYSGNIIAADINEDPLSKAKNTAHQAGVSDQLQFLLCDGLEACEPETVDTIVIAGMGGDTICGILDRSEWCMNRRYKLILQPMTKAEVLRYWLVYNEFEIENEELVSDNNTIYQIIIARFGGKTVLNDAELFTGKASLNSNKDLFKKHAELLFKRFKKALAGIESADDEQLNGKIRLHKEIICQLERMI